VERHEVRAWDLHRLLTCSRRDSRVRGDRPALGYLEPVASDPYRVLGVPRGASLAVVIAAYRRLSKLHHPDRNDGSAESTRRFQEIQNAFEELRARPHDESLDERLAKLDEEIRRRAPVRRGPDPSVVRANELIDGLSDLSSQLDGL
jgi:curved DNA-binding protein CbpA